MRQESSVLKQAASEAAEIFIRLAAWKEALVTALLIGGVIWAFVRDIPLPALAMITGGVFLLVLFIVKQAKALAVERRVAEFEAASLPSEEIPLWLLKVAERDAQELKTSLHSTHLDTQNGHVFIHWDGGEDYHQPYVSISLGYVSTSVYTLVAEFLRGTLQANHQGLTGEFQFKQLEIERNLPFTLRLVFLITSDFSVKYLREQADKGLIYFSMDDLRIRLTAKEDPSVRPSEWHFWPQYWKQQSHG